MHYILYQTNVIDKSNDVMIFIFESKYKFRNEKDLKLMLKTILTHLEDIECVTTPYNYKIVFYEACDVTGFKFILTCSALAIGVVTVPELDPAELISGVI